MKTLILNGSPRANGDTVSIINQFASKLNGEYKFLFLISNKNQYRINQIQYYGTILMKAFKTPRKGETDETRTSITFD